MEDILKPCIKKGQAKFEKKADKIRRFVQLTIDDIPNQATSQLPARSSPFRPRLSSDTSSSSNDSNFIPLRLAEESSSITTVSYMAPTMVEGSSDEDLIQFACRSSPQDKCREDTGIDNNSFNHDCAIMIPPTADDKDTDFTACQSPAPDKPQEGKGNDYEVSNYVRSCTTLLSQSQCTALTSMSGVLLSEVRYISIAI